MFPLSPKIDADKNKSMGREKEKAPEIKVSLLANAVGPFHI